MIFLELFFTFLKIGAFTFGGGYAMFPLIQSEILSKGWMTSEEIVNFVAVSESTPGPFAINISTYIGSETGGVFGAFCATFGVVLPSFVIILIVARFFAKFSNNKYVQGVMTGLKPAVIGLIAAAAVSVGKTVFFPDGFSWKVFGTFSFICSAVIFLIVILLQIKKIHPIFLIILSAGLGIAAGYLGEMSGFTI